MILTSLANASHSRSERSSSRTPRRCEVAISSLYTKQQALEIAGPLTDDLCEVVDDAIDGGRIRNGSSCSILSQMVRNNDQFDGLILRQKRNLPRPRRLDLLLR